MIGVLSLHLFGRHVPDGSNHRSFFCKPRSPAEFRESEVHNLDDAVLANHDVLGLDVPVDDSLFVCCGEAVCDLNTDVDCLFQGERLCGITQCLAVHQFHGNESVSIDFLNPVYRADIRMVESGCGFRFLYESRLILPRSGDRRGKELESEWAVEVHVLGFVHHTHSTFAKLFKNFVV